VQEISGGPKEKKQDKQAPATKATEEEEQEDLATSSFMSFEEWKEMMLRKSGQDPAQIKQHDKPKREHKGHRDGADGHADLDSLGDDGEISLDFGALSDKVSELTVAKSGESAPQPSAEPQEEQVLLDDGKMQYYRSKDAGKTCKERFSYSSFDAGATVLKTSPGAKNAKSILIENKDSYMLLECHTKNKFVIVELSDDILVDTVVLANFEFFSSMIRRFRVSVSDRYPVKLDKWVELGTFEARNSRDIQAFLIEHPQIYTKYIRIEFLTHYGNEYYCPVSLLRVHGTRMLDSWKEPDNGRDDDEPDVPTVATPEDEVPDVSSAESELTQEAAEPSRATENIPVLSAGVVPPVSEANHSQWSSVFPFDRSTDTCCIEQSMAELPTPVTNQPIAREDGSSVSVTDRPTHTDAPSPKSSGATSVSAGTENPPRTSSSSSSSTPTPQVSSTDPAAGSRTPTASTRAKQQQQPSNKANAAEAVSSLSTVKTVPSSSTTITKNKTSTPTASSASPTVQEGFFKAVTKRLQHLETNTSLSLQYIEEQSRFLQDALQRMEKRQVSRIDSFLDSLNKTVFAELRNVRAQYDQIWQSTVIALESQREQSQRETVALSERLSLLADEVVFQKRMAILQSVLLLAALVLVIFSRGYYVNAPGGHEYYPMSPRFRHHTHNASISAPTLVDSPVRSPQSGNPDQDSPEFSVASPSPAWTGSLRQPLSRSDSYQSKDLPLTPVSRSAASSLYSREATPTLTVVDDVGLPFFSNLVTPPRNMRDGSLLSDDSEVPSSVESTPVRSSGETTRSENDEYATGSDVLDRIQEQREQHEQQQDNGNVRWSAMSHLGGARKPLPALPEDVPED
jgi:hypothetical protein